MASCRTVLPWSKSSFNFVHCFLFQSYDIRAARLSGLAAAVSYYGGSLPELINEKPKCPVMLHFGETDHSIPLEKAKQVAAAHPEATTYYYAAGHGFNCDQRGSFDAAAAKEARARTLEFFRKHVG